MRTIKELLELTLDNKDLFRSGLCIWNLYLRLTHKINEEEYCLLQKYIYNNRPSKFSSFSAFEYWCMDSNYYWEPKDIKPRIKWLKYHIKKNS